MRRWHRPPRSFVTAAVVALAGLGVTQAALGQPHAAGKPGTTQSATLASASRLAKQAGVQPLTANTNAPCNAAVPKGKVRCMAVVRTPADHRLTADAAGPPSTALGPADIQSAYKLPSGGGNTVAIVDAFGDSSAESDLAVFRSQYGLPACTTANGCFRKVSQRGGTDYPPDDPGWGVETSLDLDAVSAACPACKILLVQGDDDTIDSLAAAEKEAVTLGAKYVSNSYGAGDYAGIEEMNSLYDYPGVLIAAATGDVGNIVSWPAASPKVLAVGGTFLNKDTSTARGWTEAGWAAGGSGCAQTEPKPDFQRGVSTECATRAEADIAADADPNSGLATYDTLGQSGWLQVGGTSLATPLVTAMYAMAGTPAPGTYPASYPYHDPNASSDLFDVTTGSDGDCGNLLCNAGPGWDGPTGVGTPDGLGALSSGPHGDIAGHVTDGATGQPVAGATITTNNGGYVAVTDSSGAYDINVTAGSYNLAVSAYAYQSASKDDVTVTDQQTTTQDIALTPLPHGTVSGTVTDGSGHGWPLHAKITIDGYPGGPIYTDPFTGKYSVLLAGPATYTVHVQPAYPAVLSGADAGYQGQDFQLSVDGTDLTHNVALNADMTTCDAPGYGWNGLGENFSPAGAAPRGWTVSGGRDGWSFANPTSRAPVPGGDDAFALADSTAGSVDTTLMSPVIDLTGQEAPHLTFGSAYYADRGTSTASADLSTDGGRSWRSLWRKSNVNAIGSIDVPIGSAANDKQARIRFRYTGKGAWWWALDNIAVGTHACVPVPGGIVSGLVADHATNEAVDGAVITGPGGASAIAAATDDPEAPAFYWLFVPAASGQAFTATAAGYATANANLSITPDQITRYDWSLTAAGGK